jgi:hypothetical protein
MIARPRFVPGGLDGAASAAYLNGRSIRAVPGGVMADDELEPGQVFTSPSKTLTDAHFLFFSGLRRRK